MSPFFGVHFAALVLMLGGALLGMEISDSHRVRMLWEVQDVGPSAGYYGCLGLAIAGLSPNIRRLLVIAVLSTLVVRAAWSWIHLPEEGRMLAADLTHLIAFPLGILMCKPCPPKMSAENP